MIRSVAVLLLVSVFAADPTDVAGELAIGWTRAAVKQDESALRRPLCGPYHVGYFRSG